jgi:hypothetical protein
MTAADTFSVGGTGHAPPFPNIAWPTTRRLERLTESPSMAVGKSGARLSTDRVRAAPAISPQLSLMIGQTAIGLGFWGALFPKSVKRTLGVTASTPTVQALFGVRELITGFTLAGDPTKAGMLWARVAGDVCDIAVLSSLDRPQNPKRGNAKVALGLVLAVTALDLITAVRMSTVKRNCD